MLSARLVIIRYHQMTTVVYTVGKNLGQYVGIRVREDVYMCKCIYVCIIIEL